MYRIQSARPPFLSSVSRSCRYSTDTPAKPRGLITELKGISIPSLSELQEKARLRDQAKKPLDISYLQDAPNSSLAGRLAGRVAASKSEPQPPTNKGRITQEEVDRRIQERRAARVARETAQAQEALDQYNPNALLAQKVADAAEAAGTHGVVQTQTPEKPDILPERTPVEPAKPPEIISSERLLQRIVKNLDEARFRAEKETLLVELKESPEGEVGPQKDEAASRRQRMSVAFEKKREKLAQKLQFGQSKGKSKTLSADQKKGVEKRREERLLRENEDSDEPKSPKKQKQKARSVDAELEKPVEEKELNELSLEGRFSESEENLMTPGFTGPEPVSPTLVEFFKRTPMLQSLLSPTKAPTLVADYSSYISPSTEALFSKSVNDLSPVDIATVALSHRADINLRKRKQALSTIATATRARSSQTDARA